MRRLTMMQAQWEAEKQKDKGLFFKNCKGGYVSDNGRYGLKVSGDVAEGTKICVTGKNLISVSNLNTGKGNRSTDYEYDPDTGECAIGYSTNQTLSILDAFFLPHGTYTLSFWVRSDVSEEVVVGIFNTGTDLSLNPQSNSTEDVYYRARKPVTKGEFSKIVQTFTVDSAKTGNVAIEIQPGYKTYDGSFVFKELQLERGDAATDYEPYGAAEAVQPRSMWAHTEGIEEWDDAWYPHAGDFLWLGSDYDPVDPQPLLLRSGDCNVIQIPAKYPAKLEMTALVRR